MNLGYYRTNTVQEGNFLPKVKNYASLAYVGGVDAGPSEVTDPAVIKPRLKKIIKQIAGKDIHMLLDLEMNGGRLKYGETLKCAAPYQNFIEGVIVADEEQLDLETAEEWVDAVDAKLNRVWDFSPPLGIGASFSPSQTLALPKEVLRLFDFHLLWGYRAHPAETTRKVIQRLEKMYERIGYRSFFLVVEAYDRLNQPVSADVVRKTLEWAEEAQQASCKGALCFAYGRQGGVKDHPEIEQIIKEFA